MADGLKAELRELLAKKDALESEIGDIVEALNGSGMAGPRGPLVDGEGYPRADVDVHGTRTLRHKHATLNTDHKELMKQIEEKMHALHALPSMRSGARPSSAPSAAASTAPNWVKESPAVHQAAMGALAWAVVDDVSAGGPAEASGLQVGDLIVKFGSVSLTEGDPSELMATVASIVSSSEGADIDLTVARRDGGDEVYASVSVSLRPQRWDGRGLIGCHITPLAAPSRIGAHVGRE